MDDEEWDLFAVVRNISTTAAATTTSKEADEATTTIDSILATILSPTIIEDQLIVTEIGVLDDDHDDESKMSESASGGGSNNPFDELGELYKPFFRADQWTKPSLITADTMHLLKRPLVQQQQNQLLIFQRQHQHHQQQYFAQQPALPSPSPPPPPPPHPPYRCRKRKSDQKRTTCQVRAENILTSDKWAWRKYGQKPIKGSSYPRSYYRCSSTKGCTARKQVERSPTDPNMYVVTYTGDHSHPHPTHRNSLAGSTRTKFFVPPPPPPPPSSDDSTTTTTPLTVGPSGRCGGEGENEDDDGVYGFDEILIDVGGPDPDSGGSYPWGEGCVAAPEAADAAVESPGKVGSG